MPRVGSQKFPYTPAGEKAAATAANRTGKPLKMAAGKGDKVCAICGGAHPTAQHAQFARGGTGMGQDRKKRK